MVIAFTNQKGGCGKSTLATALSFYLIEKGKRVLVLDTDEQQSLYQMYLSDTSHFDVSFSFEVKYCDIQKQDEISSLINSYKNKENDFLIIDSPGIINLKVLNIVTLADVIVVPFSYDHKTLTSTLTWLQLYKYFKHDISKIAILANRIKTTVSKSLLEKGSEKLQGEGFFVCNNYVPDLNSINLLNTCTIEKKTLEKFLPAFNEIYSKFINNK